MSDSVVATSFNAGTGFSVVARYARLDCETPEYQGLWIEARVNLLNGERRALISELEAADARAQAEIATRGPEARRIDEAVAAATAAVGAATDPESRMAADAQLKAAKEDQKRFIEAYDEILVELRRHHLELICPYVRAWNITTPDPAADDPGCVIAVPAPAVGGLSSFEATDPVIEGWIRASLIEGYRSGKGLRSTPSVASRQPTSGPQIVSATAD